MDLDAMLLELFGRVDGHVEAAVDGLGPELLTTPPEPGANHIGWLVWHLTRVEDSHVAEVLEEEQVWVSGSWGERFGLDSDPANTGYGHSAADVAAVLPDGAAALRDYRSAVAGRTRELLGRLRTEELDRVVDESWDPPVTLGVRLVSIADDEIQHAGQALYARGLLERQRLDDR